MPTSNPPSLPNDNDSDDDNYTITPANNSKIPEDNEEPDKTKTDMLAELAAKTAELAKQIQGSENPKKHILEISDSENSKPEDIYTAIDAQAQTTGKQRAKPRTGSNPAIELIRGKLNKLYKNEPDATEEASETIALSHGSKYQQYMYNLTTSGKSLADIQTEWHNYYVALPNEEKHQVWKEFYKNQENTSSYAKHTKDSNKTKPVKTVPHKLVTKNTGGSNKTISEIKSRILDKITAGGRLKPIHHIKSALFGIGMAAFVGLAVIFIFFNQVFIAPFVSPSRTVSATPIIGNSPESIGPESKLIIPKINLEVPVIYGLGTVDERTIQNALEKGVVHYAASPEPGEIGNSVIVGHSSNNIFNSGKYKFAFVLLRRMEIDDTFFIQKDGIRYTYKIFDKKIVKPTNTSVLGPSTRANTVTLITCDPPGTSINRLIVIAEQVSPDPSGNKKAVINVKPNLNQVIPSNSRSLWSRLLNLF